MHKLFKHTVFVGKKAFFLPSCHSTNDMASILLAKNAQPQNGTVIYTDHQTSGRGQRGNTWESLPEKNALLSVILQTEFVDPSDFFNLTILTSLSVHDLLAEYIKDDLRIKWPNDIMVGKKKIGGILIENYIRNNAIEWCIVGIGLNINQKSFRDKKAISMANICLQEFDREEVINILLQKIERRYLELRGGGHAKMTNEYMHHLYWKDEIHVFEDTKGKFNGRIMDVEPSGKLVVELEEGKRAFDFKQIKFIR